MDTEILFNPDEMETFISARCHWKAATLHYHCSGGFLFYSYCRMAVIRPATASALSVIVSPCIDFCRGNDFTGFACFPDRQDSAAGHVYRYIYNRSIHFIIRFHFPSRGNTGYCKADQLCYSVYLFRLDHSGFIDQTGASPGFNHIVCRSHCLCIAICISEHCEVQATLVISQIDRSSLALRTMLLFINLYRNRCRSPSRPFPHAGDDVPDSLQYDCGQ